jgi:hypothetical protein
MRVTVDPSRGAASQPCPWEWNSFCVAVLFRRCLLPVPEVRLSDAGKCGNINAMLNAIQT